MLTASTNLPHLTICSMYVCLYVDLGVEFDLIFNFLSYFKHREARCIVYMCFIRQLLPLILIATSDINKQKNLLCCF